MVKLAVAIEDLRSQMSASPGFDSRPMHDSVSSCEFLHFVFLLPLHTNWDDQTEGGSGRYELRTDRTNRRRWSGVLFFVSTRQRVRQPSLLETLHVQKGSSYSRYGPLDEDGYYTHYSEKIDMRNAASLPAVPKSYRLVNETREERNPWSSLNADTSHTCVLFHNP